MEQDVAKAKELLKEAQVRQKRYADLKLKEHTFSIGDKVWLSTSNLRIPDANKFTSKWIGPFEIKQVVSPLAMRLELPSTMRLHPVIHVSRLKPYHSSDSFGVREFSRPPPIAGEDVFVAERILDRRVVKRGKDAWLEYLIQWQGYPIYDATWEPVSNLLGPGIQKMRAEYDRVLQLTPLAELRWHRPSKLKFCD